jgi:hypothetical protein
MAGDDEPVILPDGSILQGELLGQQDPRFFTVPDRHIEPVDGCRSCASDVHNTGCGEYASEEVLPWAEAHGYEMDPWQDWSLRNILGLKPTGRWAAGTNKLIVSRQNGKGTILEVRELGGLFVTGEEVIVHTAHEYKTAVVHFNRLKDTLSHYPSLMRRVRRMPASNVEHAIELKPQATLIFGSGGKEIRRKVAPVLVFLARSKGSGRGFTGDTIVYDEDMYLTSDQLAASLPAMSARATRVPGPQVIYMGSAGTEESEQAGKLRTRILKDDKKMFGAEWSINPHLDSCPRDLINGRKSNYYIVCGKHDDRDDPRSWAKANPGLNYRLTYQYTRDEEFMNLPEEEFDKERLSVGRWPSEDAVWSAISEDAWRNLTNEDPGKPAQPIAFAFDIDEDGRSATICAAWKHPTGRVVLEVPRDCSRMGSDWVLDRMAEIYKRNHPVCVCIPKNGPAGGLIEDGKKLWRDRLIEVGTQDEAAAYAWFMQQVRGQNLWHFGQVKAPTLWHAVGHADTRVVGDGGKTFSRRDSESDITPITSAMLAAYGLNKMATGYDPMKTIG